LVNSTAWVQIHTWSPEITTSGEIVASPTTPTPQPSFGAGRFLVGTHIAPGRYFSDPLSGCYWERLSGLGGTISEILANEFVAFDAGQWIVDILPSDLAFGTDAECSTWFTTPRRSLQANISPGVWLVGSQVNPGVYFANVNAGCYWERLRDFTGTIGGIIDNDFIPVPGPQVIEIRADDVGFHTDGDCGTWVPIGSSTSLVPTELLTLIEPERNVQPYKSSAAIESNRTMQRRKNGL
jgi:hypothetical protein